MFCKYCGREIPEGSVCQCRATAQPVYTAPVVQETQPAAETDVGAIVGNAFKTIPSAAKQLLGNTGGVGFSLGTGVIFSVIGLIVHILAWICLIASIGITLDTEIFEEVDGSFGTALGTGCLSYIIPLILTMLIPVVCQLLRREKIDWAAQFTTAASSAVLPSIVLLLGGLACMINWVFGVCILLISVVMGLMVWHKRLAKELKRTNTAGTAIAIAVVITIFVLITVWVVSAPLIAMMETDDLAGMIGALCLSYAYK